MPTTLNVKRAFKMNVPFFTKPVEVKTVDSIVKQFDTMIADLHNVAAQEHDRALGIAGKIQALIS